MAEPFENLAGHQFACIAADPPWRFKTWSAKGKGKSADQHYGTMSLESIKHLPVWNLAMKTLESFANAVTGIAVGQFVLWLFGVRSRTPSA